MGRRERKYCEKCGCYVPEGETVCISCGYDPTPKPMRRPDLLTAMYAPRVRNVTINEALDTMKTENAYVEGARAMSQTSCSTAQAVDAFASLGRAQRDAWMQVMLHDALRAKRLKR